MSRNITEIIVHCTATPEGRAVSVADIDRWHRERGFSQIGYHYVVLLDGSVKIGRPEWKTGAHCVGHNQQSIGVVYVGGLDSRGEPKDTRTLEQKAALECLLKQLKRRYPHATIHGHREFSSKACPCFNAKLEYAEI